MYIAGHVLQGLCTSLLLIAAVPPLAIGYPAAKLRTTAVIMTYASSGRWRSARPSAGCRRRLTRGGPLFWIIAAISAVALVWPC